MAASRTRVRKSRLRYREVADTLLGRIAEAHHPVGDMLPSELELCQEFGVSRYTVREALRRLDEMGVVSRRQGSGTVVRAREPSRKYVQALNSVGELLQYPEDTRLNVLTSRDVVADKTLAELLKCGPRKRWHLIEAVRRASDGVPLCLSHIYVIPKFASVRDSIGLDTSPVHALIERLFGQRAIRVEIDLFAGAISAEHARLLDVAEGTPALVIVRRYAETLDDNYEVSVIQHPAGRFTYRMELEQAWGTGPRFGP